MAIHQLSCGDLELRGKTNQTKDRVDVDTLLLHPGEFQSHLGPVEVTGTQLRQLCENYNQEFTGIVNKLMQKLSAADEGVELRELALSDVQFKSADHRIPIQIDHNLSNTMTIGRMVGPVRIEEKDGVPHLYGTLSLRGEDNVKKVLDGRFKNVSLGFNDETCKIQEVSFVTYGACQTAGVQLEEGAEEAEIPKPEVVVETPAPILTFNHPPSGVELQNVTAENVQLAEQTLAIQALQQKLNARTDYVVQLQAVQAKSTKLQASEKTLKKLSALQQKGKIMPYQLKGGMVNDILSLDSESQEKVTRILSELLMPQVELGTVSNNVAAMRAQDFLNPNLKFGDEEVKMNMEAKLEGAFKQFAGGKDANTQLGYDAKSSQYPTSKGGVITEDAPAGGSPKIAVSFANVKKVHAMLEAGDTEGAKKYLSELMKEDEDDADNELAGNENKFIKSELAKIQEESKALQAKADDLMAKIKE